MKRASLFVLGHLLLACGGGKEAPAATAPVVDAAPATPTIQFVTRTALDGSDSAPTNKAFWGDVIIIRATGFAPHASVTLRATASLRDGFYSSWAQFQADAAGSIDTAHDAPKNGTWSGVDADGPIWSMTKTETTPDEPLEQWGLRVDAEGEDGARVGRATLSRFLVADNVTRTPVSEDGLVGVYYAPNDGKKHPTILAFGGSEGGLFSGESSAAYYSALGYSVLGVAYFADKGLPEYLQEIPLEYFERAMKWLDGRADADATKLAVMGGSRGGELALLLGATFPRVTAVVAQLPSGVLWGAPQNTGPELSSWTVGGAGLPFVPGTDAFPKSKRDTDGKLVWVSTPTFDAALAAATKEQLEAATPHVEATRGPILMYGGADDQLWPSCKLAQYALDRLKAAGHAAENGDELLCYEDAGHNIDMPGSPTIGTHRAYHPLAKVWFLLGGTPQGIAKASRAADAKVRAFLKRALTVAESGS